jgi:hypothetical protein
MDDEQEIIAWRCHALNALPIEEVIAQRHPS